MPLDTIETKSAETEDHRYTATSKLQLQPTAEDDYIDYTCQARHQAIPEDRPMQSTVQLSVLCKYRGAISVRHCQWELTVPCSFRVPRPSVLMATYAWPSDLSSPLSLPPPNLSLSLSSAAGSSLIGTRE